MLLDIEIKPEYRIEKKKERKRYFKENINFFINLLVIHSVLGNR